MYICSRHLIDVISLFQHEDPITDTRIGELRELYPNLLPVENRAERKGDYVRSKEQELWLRRIVRAVILHEERHKGKEMSSRLKKHSECFIRRLYARVSTCSF